MKYQEAMATSVGPVLTHAESSYIHSGTAPWDEVLVMTSDAPFEYLDIWHDAGVYASNFLYDNFFEKHALKTQYRTTKNPRLAETFNTAIGMYGAIRWADSEQFGDDRPWAFLLLTCYVPGELIASWEGYPMDKLTALIVDGCPPEIALDALLNDIDTSLISQL